MTTRTRISVFARTAIAIACVAMLCAPAWAQYESATLTGVVTDSVGALVPGAEVKATSEANQVTSVKTNSEGRYVFAILRPGSYKVSASAKALSKLCRPGWFFRSTRQGASICNSRSGR